jgi:hypothetical protein
VGTWPSPSQIHADVKRSSPPPRRRRPLRQRLLRGKVHHRRRALTRYKYPMASSTKGRKVVGVTAKELKRRGPRRGHPRVQAFAIPRASGLTKRVEGLDTAAKLRMIKLLGSELLPEGYLVRVDRISGPATKGRKLAAAADYGVSEQQLERFIEKLDDQAQKDAKAGRLVRYEGRGHLAKLLGD